MKNNVMLRNLLIVPFVAFSFATQAQTGSQPIDLGSASVKNVECNLTDERINSNEDLSSFVDAAQTSIGAQDQDLFASVVANAIDSNPGLANEFLCFAASEYSSALPKVVEAIENTSPENITDAIAILTGLLENDPLLLASVLSAVSPAGRGGNPNPLSRVPSFVNLPAAARENPNIVSGN